MAHSKPSCGSALCLLVILTLILTLRHEKTFTYERPVHSAILSLLVASPIVFISSQFLSSSYFTQPPSQGRRHSYSAIPLEERGGRKSRDIPSRDSSPVSLLLEKSSSKRLGRRPKLAWIAAVVISIVVRVELLRHILENVACSKRGVEALIPVAIAILDAILNQAPQPKDKDYDPMSATLMDDIHDYVTLSRFRYVPPSVLITWAWTASSMLSIRSTIICSIVGNIHILIPSLQTLGVLFDVVIVIGLARLLADAVDYRSRGILVAGISLISAFLLGVASTIFLYIHPEHRVWASSLTPAYFSGVVTDTSLIVSVIVMICYVVPEVHPLSLLMLVTFSSLCLQRIRTAWANLTAFPPQNDWNSFWIDVLLLSGMAFFLHTRNVSENKHRSQQTIKIPLWFHLITITILIISQSLNLYRSNVVGFHPIDVLIYTANSDAKQWSKQAATSTSIGTAIQTYKERYGRDPPPNFDKWYRYARDRGSKIIDDFDQIRDDLAPFWAIEPTEIRTMTDRILNSTWNEVAGISIRGGTVAISPHVLPTHRWMLDGAARMIARFAEWLPDMDIALNLNDEPRVAVPYEDIQELRRRADRVTTKLAVGENHKFNSVPADKQPIWMDADVTLDATGPTQDFAERSFHQDFYDYGAATCPPNTPARRQFYWNKRDLCAWCAYPHSVGQFVQNWTLAADLCHQPDIANLHGFHLSPAAYKPSRKLLPVFSQSKVPGYNDILYPSAWNYIDKVTYDPARDISFPLKKDPLFWRGATSEGVSFAGTWKGMLRQRFVHLANNATATKVPILQPVPTPAPVYQDTGDLADHTKKLPTYRYKYATASELSSLLEIDAGFVDDIKRCGLNDCPNQASEFGFKGGVDFQDHWNYKYLMDLDGAGFSGRFLPFLKSNSLPFKAGIFREWHDDRLTPWLHFVPIDTRLHSLHSTLMYFTGARGKIAGKEIVVGAKGKEAEYIAEQGRIWAESVLRKEDMEIYFFRLLLEWGRLIDDRRESIGFTL